MKDALIPQEAAPDDLSVRLLDAPEAARFAPLTFPALRGRLGADEPDSNLFAVGVALLGEPVGLALAEIAPGGASSSSTRPRARSTTVPRRWLAKASGACKPPAS